MGVTHADPVPQFSDQPYLRSPGQYASDHIGVSCQQLGEVVLTTDTANVDFLNIPGTYRDLLLIFNGRGDRSAPSVNLGMQFNGDTGANYDSESVYSYGVTAGGIETIAGTYMVPGIVSALNAPSNVAGHVVITIPDYARTAWQKTAFVGWGYKSANSTGSVLSGTSAVFWRNTAAITQVTLLATIGNLLTDSRATLWGLV